MGDQRIAITLLAIALVPLLAAAARRDAPGQMASAAVAAPPTLAQCRARLSAPGPADLHCLRRVYTQPVAQWPAPDISPGVMWQELGPLQPPPEPTDNPSTPAKIALGKRLFEDPRLSRSGQIACASCHDRQLGWGDGRSVSFGHDRQAGRRNAMSVAMSGYTRSLFWDGRARSLEHQATFPIRDPREMADSLARVERRLGRDRHYRDAFAQAFGELRITMHRVAQALAAYQRSLAPLNSRFDRFLEGRHDLLDDRQLWGLHLFRTKARCMNCHNGPAFSDDRFHNLGLHFFGRTREDLGHYEVSGNPADSGRFRTPSLRGVGRNGPYMHNGLFPSLEGIVNMYAAGGFHPRPATPEQARDPRFPHTDPLLRPLELDRDERKALVEFLEAL